MQIRIKVNKLQERLPPAGDRKKDQYRFLIWQHIRHENVDLDPISRINCCLVTLKEKIFTVAESSFFFPHTCLLHTGSSDSGSSLQLKSWRWSPWKTLRD